MTTRDEMRNMKLEIRNQKSDGFFFFIFLLSSFIFFSRFTFAQSNYTKYWVQFSDKNNTPFSISNPSQFLSQEALERRQKQNISIVQNDLPLTPSYMDSISSTGAKIINKSKWFNAVSISIADTNLIDSMLKKISTFPFVSRIDTVSRMKKNKDAMEENILPANFSFKSSDEEYGLAFNQINMIKTNLLHAMGFRGQGMTIAVLDNGFFGAENMEVFNDLRNENRLLGTWDIVTGDANVYDDGGHGTNVLSTMAANLYGTMVGTAPKANYWLLHTEINTSEFPLEEDNWVAGAEFADSVGADMINSSLGYYTFDDTTMNHTYADMDGNTTRVTIGADMAASKGILVCNSAGNEGGSAWNYIISPADGDSVLAVGAVDENGIRTSFSSVGPSADGRIKPNVAAQGGNTIVAGAGNTIGKSNGTSFSSPITAGSVACLWQAFPNKTNMQIIDAVQKGASQANNPDNLLGYGVLNLANSFRMLNEENFNKYNKDNLPLLFPNPFHDNLTLLFFPALSGQISIDLFDIAGKLIIAMKGDMPIEDTYYQYELKDASSLSRGIYWLRIKTASKNYRFKVVKM